MELTRDLSGLPDTARNAAIALGNFDGLHHGHRAILEETLAQAKSLDTHAAVMTFEPHPREFFNPAAPSLRLMRLAEKIAALRAMGFKHIFMLRFNTALANTGADDFISQQLVQRLAAKAIITGENFRFGSKRSGDHATLTEAGKKHGFLYRAIAPICNDAGVISSSAIRALLAEGKLESIPRFLGAPYAITGRVMHGDKRGRTLGFPTANLSLKDVFLPRLGVYKMRVSVAGSDYPAIGNIGIRPSVGGTIPRAEIHIFGFDKDIYGQKIRAELHSFLRPEQKFDSLDALKKQIIIDCEQAQKS